VLTNTVNHCHMSRMTTLTPFNPHCLTPYIGTALAMGQDVAMDALISDCGAYRYWLARVWALGKPILVWVMLNPSTADAQIDDPTIKRCMAFARENGYGGILVVNLFAFRATKPEHMKAAADPVGPDNDLWLALVYEMVKATGGDVVAGWGVHGTLRDRDYDVVAQAERAGVAMKCLGHSKDGCPKHPLYIKGGTPFVPLRRAL
jgi:hypothetical protein